ncbi:MAG: ATP-binding protein [bacterium]
MPQDFFGRKIELQELNDLWLKVPDKSQFLVLYGKRRVGKTELVKEFIKGKSACYYLASKTSARDQLKSASTAILSQLGFETASKINFDSWRDFFDQLKVCLLQEPKDRVIVVDEFPYLVESDSAIPSLFQYGWDERLKNTRTLLILMGSSINMMYQHALNYSSPLYGRRTANMLLEPFSFNEAKDFLKTPDFQLQFSLYSLVGGIPAYLQVLESKKSLEYNLEHYFLKSNSFLGSEPELLINEEFQDPKIYLTILKAVGLKRSKFSQIQEITGLNSSQLPFYLKNLIELRLIQKQIPITEKNKENNKKSSYYIQDRFLRFYFSFIFPNISKISSGFYQELIGSKSQILNSLIAKSYEESTLEFIQNTIRLGILPVFYELGRWWDGANEIDLVGLNEDTNSILFVETKWTEKPVEMEVLNKLKFKAKSVKWGQAGRSEYFCLVSRPGFTKELLELAENNPNLVLIQGDTVVNSSEQIYLTDEQEKSLSASMKSAESDPKNAKEMIQWLNN